jgi:hypothetical protein
MTSAIFVPLNITRKLLRKLKMAQLSVCVPLLLGPVDTFADVLKRYEFLTPIFLVFLEN